MKCICIAETSRIKCKINLKLQNSIKGGPLHSGKSKCADLKSSIWT